MVADGMEFVLQLIVETSQIVLLLEMNVAMVLCLVLVKTTSVPMIHSSWLLSASILQNQAKVLLKRIT